MSCNFKIGEKVLYIDNSNRGNAHYTKKITGYLNKVVTVEDIIDMNGPKTSILIKEFGCWSWAWRFSKIKPKQLFLFETE